MSHAAEIALQRFHIHQPLGKTRLNMDEFKTVFRNSYRFLKTLAKTDEQLTKIFMELDSNKDSLITYKEYLTWSTLYIAKKGR